MFFGEYIRFHHQSLAFVPEGFGSFHNVARKQLVKALHAYGSGLTDLEKNVLVEMDLLVKRIEEMPNMTFQCMDVFGRSLSNVISLVLCGELIPDDDPNKDDFWQHTRGGDFFLRSAVNSIMTSFPFLRFLPGKFGEEYRQHKNVDQKIREKYFYDMKKTFTPGKLRGLVDHYIDEQRMEKKSGNDVFFTDERIMVQLSEVIDAGKDISLPIIQCYHSKNNSIMDVFSIAGITSI
ncbi:uncharacterized protein LOC123555172 isoform X1 [Mercenaria mercenaria]|uniref:uncharacterized protein LOC123555172 isoform X1 n=1 Tax=Mercenaria mercenaria TaxID=6596 RepID=UPI00234E6D51|nr:uncharacterized protein LOC123555172 isoform X1 [Mercenaria mercenaria]XP_053381285.1 uncharacterized protein LOC123555172 isoform X1 [Mercenaria mercenaria]